MADRGDTHYHVPRLNQWFLVSSALLLVAVVWTVIDDWNAEWKIYQRRFRELELQKAEAQLEELSEEGMLARRDELLARVEEANQALASRRKEVEEAAREVYVAKEDRFRAEQAFKSRKGDDSWERLLAEDRILVEGAEPDEEAAAWEDRLALTFELEKEFEAADRAYQEAQARLAAIQAEVIAAEKDLSAQTRDLDRVLKRIETLDPQDVESKIANTIRDFPGLDFIGPNLKIDKQVLSDLTFELNFTKKTRIDMCTTCHMGADKQGFEAEEQPFATHPNLDLYLSSTSPHPLGEVGCTICHRGSGESLSFQHVDHRPSDAAEEEEWHDEYHWHKQHHWDYPMLRSQNVEASCVQCHKTSMELIAADAPKVTEGYRLFEEKGCYACHKVEWFPTKRRPGPSLTNLAAKLDPEWVNSWIADPRGFRPTTNMPQVFHLENYGPDEVIVTSNYGQGEEILGQAWNESAVAAITHFLYTNHPVQQLDPIPVEGDAERGREVFRLRGCLACHNMEPHPGTEAGWNDLAFEVGEYNDHGPNLRGVNTKLDRTWLFHWLKDPAAYSPETRMPNLRLSDQDAADVAAYIMDDPDGVFGETPEGWQTEPGQAEMTVLQEQARWFYSKLGRFELERRLNGENQEHRWDQKEPLMAAVGEAMVQNYGCYSCHEIEGMQQMMPIGVELTNWASKTVDKLDFGMAYRREVAGRPKLSKYYHEGWLERKLHAPRSFDVDKIKNPKEKLRMPWFDFSDEEVDSLVTFVMGLVNDEVQDARMEPTPEQLAMDHGMRVVRQNNCLSCHQLEPSTVTFEHEDGRVLTAQAELMPFEGDVLPPRPSDLADLRSEMEAWAEYMEEDPPEEVVVRLLEAHPDLGAPAETVIIPTDKLRAVTPAVGGDFVKLVTRYYTGGVEVPDPEYDPSDPESYPTYFWTSGYDEDTGDSLIEDVDGVSRAYAAEEYDKLRWTFAPPVLWNEGHKVQREWFYAFLHDPQTLRKQIQVRMPSFTYYDGEAEAVADYFAGKARKDWSPRFARTARLLLGRESTGVAEGSEAWNAEHETHWPVGGMLTGSGGGLTIPEVAEGSSLDTSVVARIEQGSQVDIDASFGKLSSWAAGQGFSMVPQVSPSYEAVGRRSASYFAAHADRVLIGEAVAADGVNCYQCHPRDGVYPETPIAWAPPLENVRERLREDWVWEWLWNPGYVYPGTAMPANFAGSEPQYQDQYPGSDNAAQVQAVMDWLFNMDRAPSVGAQ